MQYMVLLVVIADFYLSAEYDLTGIQLFQSVYHFQKGGLSGAIVTDDGNVLAAFDLNVSICKECQSGETLGQAVNGQNIISAGDSRRERKVHVILHFGGFIQSFNLIQCLFAAFRALDGFFPIEGFQFIYDFLLMLQFPLLIQIGIPPGNTKLLFFLSII